METDNPDSVLERMRAPAAEVTVTMLPGDPYSRPWEDLRRRAPTVTTERFQGNLYSICSARKQW